MSPVVKRTSLLSSQIVLETWKVFINKKPFFPYCMVIESCVPFTGALFFLFFFWLQNVINFLKRSKYHFKT